MKFIHAADLHLDRSFEGLTAIPEKFQPYLKTANQQMLQRIVDAAIKRSVDFVLLAGDTFHQNRPSLKTQQFFFQEIERLHEKKIPVFMNFGNHDFYEPERYWFTFPKNIQLFTQTEVETKCLTTRTGAKVAITSFSYQQPTIEQEMASAFPVRQAVDFQIGMYHGGQMPYAPFTLSQLTEKGYDYWALGHIHVPQVLHQAPWVIYPGTPQGHTKKENEVAGVAFVSGEKNALQVEMLPVAPLAWQKQTVSLANARQIRQIIPLVKEALSFEQPTLVQVTLTDGERFGSELVEKVASGELQSALQTQLSSQLFLTELQVAQAKLDPPYLPVGADLVAQLLTTYEDEKIFQELLRDVYQQPELRSLLTESFKKEVLQTVQGDMKLNYRFKEERHAN